MASCESECSISSFAALLAIVTGKSEIQAYRFGVTDVKVSIRLRGESSDDRLMLAGGDVSIDDLSDEIAFHEQSASNEAWTLHYGSTR